jgi:hypothetical protein
MEMIKSKKKLHSKIRSILENENDLTAEYEEFTFCEGMGEPTFKITIEKTEEDIYFDDKGQKWVKVE